MKASIIICTLDRAKCLTRLLDSLDEQSRKDFEVITCTEEGVWSQLKEKSWRKAKGEIIIFLDDDVVCSKYWFQNMMYCFDKYSDVIGVTGPTIVPKEYLSHRDALKDTFIHKLYCKLFMDGKKYWPGRISSWGANTLGANFETKYTQYEQEVDFLEPSQFGMRRWVMEMVGGFDTTWEGVGEWGDVDLQYRAKQCGRLLFHPAVKAWHMPESGDRVYKKRLETASRYRNYCKFADKFIKPSIKNKIYRLFLRTYFLSVQLMK